MNDILLILLTHEPAFAVERMTHFWRSHQGVDLLVVYGGMEQVAREIENVPLIFVTDPRLRTKDHQRERQSYNQMWKQIADYLRRSDHAYLWFVEFDHLPTGPAAAMNLRSFVEQERADAAMFHLKRVDRTISPHYLGHAHQPEFHRFFRDLTVRRDPDVILSMFGSGSFWRREAFLDVADQDEPFPIYLEIFIPTIAHHRGWRLRDLGAQNRTVLPRPADWLTVESARALGNWTVHPLKQAWR